MSKINMFAFGSSLQKFVGLSALLVSLGFTPVAKAFYTVQETGEILKTDEIRAAAEVQFVTSGDDGVNVIGKVEKGFDDESNIRVTAGTGTTDFELGAFYKWVPFPDYEDQPAVGVTFGVSYARYEMDDVPNIDSENEIALRTIPFASKKFEMNFGDLTPYVSIPLGLRNYNDDTDLTSQFVIGSFYHHPDFEYCDFSAEIGIDLGEAVSYISLGAVFPSWILE